jgi:pheromone shutdown protein TraB
MTTPNISSDKTWELIENEKRRDRFIHRVNRMAWIATFVIVLLIVAMVAVQVIEMAKGALLGAVPWMTVMGLAMPLIDVLWKLSLLVAALSTVGIFLRLRTASLTEIQLRLAALEQMLASRPDSEQR